MKYSTLFRLPLTVVLTVALLFPTTFAFASSIEETTTVDVAVPKEGLKPSQESTEGVFGKLQVPTSNVNSKNAVVFGVGETIAETFPDPNMAAAVAGVLGKSVNDTLTAPMASSVTSLGLSGKSISSIEGIEVFSNLTELSLGRNNLTVLPDSIGDLTNLSYLNLYENNLTALPESFGNLESLSYLYLGGNNLTVLPDSFGNLTELSFLDLGENNLTSLPKELHDFIISRGYFFLDHQTATGDFGTAHRNNDFTFTPFPILTQIPTYEDETELEYTLIRPGSLAETTLTFDQNADGTFTIPASYLGDLGSYSLVARTQEAPEEAPTLFQRVLDYASLHSSVWTMNFTVAEAPIEPEEPTSTPTPPVAPVTPVKNNGVKTSTTSSYAVNTSDTALPLKIAGISLVSLGTALLLRKRKRRATQ